MKRKIVNDDEDQPEKKDCPNIRCVNNRIYFYEDINQSTCLDLILILGELISESRKNAIDQNLETPTPIYLHINSSGGTLLDAFAVIDTIKSSPVKIISIIEGHAASAATLISVVCHERYIRTNALMLIHELRAGNWGKFSDMELEIQNLTDMMKTLTTIYKTHTKLTDKDLKQILHKDRYWNAEKCLQKGLVDKII